MSFADLGAHPTLLQALEAKGFVTPTPVQAAVLDAAMLGRDLLVSAETGSGKTVAFGLALAHTLLGEAPSLPRATTPKALVLAPTRELALQVQQELAWLYGAAGMRSVACVGGAPLAQQPPSGCRVPAFAGCAGGAGGAGLAGASCGRD